MKIYLKLNKQPKTIKELLLTLFSYGNDIKKTNITTYSDEKCTKIQCLEGKYRSFDDVFDIVKTYFPDTNYKELIHELLILDFNLNEPLYLKMSNCQTISKIVLYYTTDYFNNNIFGINRYNSEYSWDQLLNSIDIKSIDDIKTYVKKYIKTKEDITDKIKTWEDILKVSDKKEKDIIPWKNPINKQQLSQNAFAKIQLISEVLNEGIILDFNNKEQYKYYPYFIKEGSGWVLSSNYCYYVSDAGFGCYFKSSKLAIYASKQFINIYKDYLP